MTGKSGSQLAVLSVFCILTIFFFPGMQGPYSAVHGPVTALQAARAATRLRIAIVQSALKSAQNSRLVSLFMPSRTRAAVAEFRLVSLAECDGILRC